MRLRLAVAACMLCASFAARADVTVSSTGSDTFSGTWNSPNAYTVTYNLGDFVGSTGGTIVTSTGPLLGYQITNSQVILSDVGATGVLYTPFTGFEFTDLSEDPGFSSLTLDSSSTLVGGVATFTGNTLTINFAGIDVMPGQTATYDFTTGTSSSVTPEPASIALLATGLVGIGGVVRRRMIA